METLKSTKFDWKKVLVVCGLVFLGMLVAFLITWQYMEDSKQQEVETLQTKINNLESENKELEGKLMLIEEALIDEDELIEEEAETEEDSEEVEMDEVEDSANLNY